MIHYGLDSRVAATLGVGPAMAETHISVKAAAPCALSRIFHVIFAECAIADCIWCGPFPGAIRVSRDALSLFVVGLLVVVAAVALTLAFRL
jgi:hypothetical protein